MSDLIKSLRSLAKKEAPEFYRLPHEHIAWRAADEIEGLRKRLADAEAGLRWVCSLYVVADELQGSERELRLNRAVEYAKDREAGNE